MNDVKTYIREAEDKMNLSVAFLDEALASIRAGKANPRILDQIRVEYGLSQQRSDHIYSRCQDDNHTTVGKTDVQRNRKSLAKFRNRHYARKQR